MSLNKSSLQSDIKSAFKNMKDSDGDEEQALDALAGKLAEAVDTFVKTATINYTAGLTTPTGGPVQGTFGGSLS